jgi:L-seryl-tRNA(Ser) seleniumtransferase
MLPSVSDLLLTDEAQRLSQGSSRLAVVNAIRATLDRTREEILSGEHTAMSLQVRIAALPRSISDVLGQPFPFSLRKVLNATGVILHTNLGRAPLGKSALRHMVDIASGYSNLELDLESGERGSRDVHVESLLLTLISRLSGRADFAGTHRAIIVNNCAAATFLALHALAEGREVIVSRGELVEIGGGFRIPEILKASRAVLKEVGTTNRTRAEDYANAISSDTGMILRVHQSNFSMEGFVRRPSAEELVALGERAQVPVFEDQGTGLLHSLGPYGIQREPTLIASLVSGCSLAAASGDKLLGGPQCGILVGRKDLIDKIRKDPLFRTFRVDKLIYAALEGTLAEYLSDSPEAIPIVRMLQFSSQEIKSRCEQVVSHLSVPGLSASVIQVESVIGGGTAPKAQLQSFAISLRHSAIGANDLLLAFRRASPAIIGRIGDDLVLLDLRTIDPESDPSLIRVLNEQLLIAAATVEEVGG